MIHHWGIGSIATIKTCIQAQVMYQMGDLSFGRKVFLEGIFAKH
jgi:hypothetical protein